MKKHGLCKLQMSVLSTFKRPFSKINTLCVYCRSYSTAPAKDLFDVLEEKVEEDIGYEQWLLNTKEALKNSKGRFWLGKSTVIFETDRIQF